MSSRAARRRAWRPQYKHRPRLHEFAVLPSSLHGCLAASMPMRELLRGSRGALLLLITLGQCYLSQIFTSCCEFCNFTSQSGATRRCPTWNPTMRATAARAA